MTWKIVYIIGSLRALASNAEDWCILLLTWKEKKLLNKQTIWIGDAMGLICGPHVMRRVTKIIPSVRKENTFWG